MTMYMTRRTQYHAFITSFNMQILPYGALVGRFHHDQHLTQYDRSNEA